MKRNRTKHPLSLLLLLLSLLLLSGCVATTQTPATADSTSPASTEAPAPAESLFPLTITDALGQEFTFAEPLKLACDWHGCYETAADLGVVLHAAAMRPEMLDSVFYAPVGLPEHIIEDLSNPELWAATEMDVFLSRVPDDPFFDAIREMVPVFFLHHPSYGVSSETGYQAYIANARLLGQLTDQPEAAEAAIARFETMIANLKALSTPALAEQSVGMIWSDEVYYGMATDNPFCVLLAEVGLGRCMGESTGRFVEYNAEEVLALDPDLIIYMLEGGPSHTERTDPVWPQLTAVKEGRVYDVIGTRYTCCSMRGLIHSFQEYVSVVLPMAGIPAPGPVETFDPTQSPLVQPTSTTTAAAATAGAFPVTIEHKFGSTTIETQPERVVSLGFTDQDYLLALGVVPVGIRDWFGEQPNAVWPWARDLLNGAEPEVLSRELNFEQIARLQPDLIVAIYTSLTQEEFDLLSAIAPVVTAPPGLEDYAITWQEQTRYTGQIVGQAERAEELVTQLEEKMVQARADHPEFEGVEYAFASVYAGEYYLYGEKSTASRFLTSLGFVVPADILELTENENDYSIFSAERMDLVDRPLAVWSEGPTDEGVIALVANPLYAMLPVHTEGRDLFLGLDLYGGAFSFSSVLSLDLLVDDLVPAISLALDGDPATVPTLGETAAE